VPELVFGSTKRFLQVPLSKNIFPRIIELMAGCCLNQTLLRKEILIRRKEKNLTNLKNLRKKDIWGIAGRAPGRFSVRKKIILTEKFTTPEKQVRTLTC